MCFNRLFSCRFFFFFWGKGGGGGVSLFALSLHLVVLTKKVKTSYLLAMILSHRCVG